MKLTGRLLPRTVRVGEDVTSFLFVGVMFGGMGLLILLIFPPWHFHVRYAEQKAKFSLDDLSVLEGEVPRRVRSLVLEWAAEHLGELRKNWELAQAQKPLERIAPLD